jgi:hypothetical protein
MIDLHLINVALAGLGIGTGAILLIAAAIITIAAIGQHRTAAQTHRARIGTMPGQAASQAGRVPEVPEVPEMRREPALR